MNKHKKSTVKRRVEGQGSKADIDSWLWQKQSLLVRRVELPEESWKLSCIFCLGTGLTTSRLWVWAILVSSLWLLDLLRVILLVYTSNTLFHRLDLRPTARCVCTLTNMMALYLQFNLRPPEQQAGLGGRDHNHFTRWRGRVGYFSCAHGCVAQNPLTSA